MTTRVRILGTGLIGASVGIALTKAGYDVGLVDPSPTAMGLARDLGAGHVVAPGDSVPDVVVVAAPPDVTGAVVADSLERWPEAVVTDVASVKVSVLQTVAGRGADLSRYVGSHPMAGREKSGAVAARGDLFQGRAWVVVPHETSTDDAVRAVVTLAEATGAAVRRMSAGAHDAAVAAVSHLPQVAASLVAAQLRGLPAEAVDIAGQGLRDVTRIAASDPRLWTQILAGNAEAVAAVLRGLQADLAAVVAALDGVDGPAPALGALEVIARLIGNGNDGHALIPGKHGAVPTAYRTVSVLVPDAPGNLARLLADVGAAGVNLEDLRLDHGLGQPFGIAEIDVIPAAAEGLRANLAERGWRLHD